MFIKNTARFFAMALLAVSALQVNVASAAGRGNDDEGKRLRIGGVANVYFIDSTHLVGAISGTFAGLSSTINSMSPQPDGTILADLTHNFLTADNGFIITNDAMKLVPIAGSPNVFTFTVDYTVTKSGNGLEGFEGEHFKSRGVVDMGKGVAVVRYDGEIVSHHHH